MAKKNPLRERFEKVVNQTEIAATNSKPVEPRTKVNMNLLDEKVDLFERVQLKLRSSGTKKKKQELWEEAIDLLAAKYEVES